MHFSIFTVALGFPLLALANYLNASCTDFHLDVSRSYALFAQCIDSTGQNKSASLDLDVCIANDDGQLVWRTNGGFAESCNPIRITHNSTDLSPLLEANCTNNHGQGVTYLSLDDGITAIDGTLVCQTASNTAVSSSMILTVTSEPLVTATSLFTFPIPSTPMTVNTSSLEKR